MENPFVDRIFRFDKKIGKFWAAKCGNDGTSERLIEGMTELGNSWIDTTPPPCPTTGLV